MPITERKSIVAREPMVARELTVAKEPIVSDGVVNYLKKRFGMKAPQKGTPREFVLKTNEVWTFEQDFVLTEVMKYPSCADIPSTDIPTIQLVPGKEEIMNTNVDIEFFPNAEHPLMLPQPLYLRRGTPLSFTGGINITSPSDVKLGFMGYYPIVDTQHNPVLFGKPYFQIAKFTNVQASTPIAPIAITIQDWEIFTLTNIVAIVRKNDTSAVRLLTTDENFNIKIEISGRTFMHREGHRWLICGTPENPKFIDPPYENLVGTNIFINIYPAAWGDTDYRTIYIIMYGKMKYDFGKLKSRFV